MDSGSISGGPWALSVPSCTFQANTISSEKLFWGRAFPFNAIQFRDLKPNQPRLPLSPAHLGQRRKQSTLTRVTTKNCGDINWLWLGPDVLSLIVDFIERKR